MIQDLFGTDVFVSDMILTVLLVWSMVAISYLLQHAYRRQRPFTEE